MRRVPTGTRDLANATAQTEDPPAPIAQGRVFLRHSRPQAVEMPRLIKPPVSREDPSTPKA
jgi:hypothetical protein